MTFLYVGARACSRILTTCSAVSSELLPCLVSHARLHPQQRGARYVEHGLYRRLRRRPTLQDERACPVKELWPEGVLVTASADVLHAAATSSGADGANKTLLEEVCSVAGLLSREAHPVCAPSRGRTGVRAGL